MYNCHLPPFSNSQPYFLSSLHGGIPSKTEKVPRGIRGEKSSKDMASSRKLF